MSGVGLLGFRVFRAGAAPRCRVDFRVWEGAVFLIYMHSIKIAHTATCSAALRLVGGCRRCLAVESLERERQARLKEAVAGDPS